MNRERPEEQAAKPLLEAVLGVELEHADTNGGVDYRSVDGSHAVEVTRVTDGRKRAGREALDSSRVSDAPHGDLQTCWIAVVPDTKSRLKTFVQNVHPPLVELERAGEVAFDRNRAAVHVIERGPLSGPYESLLAAGVEMASAVPDHSHRRHTHRVIPSLGSGGSASGSDEALELLTSELDQRADNHRKLRESRAQNRHLFVWIDDDTRFDLARALAHEPPKWDEHGFGLPSKTPHLHPSITQLWVVHERWRRGWRWDGGTWRDL